MVKETMKFDSSALPMLPTPQQLTELNDLLISASELSQIYAALERHPRVINSPRSLDLFNNCTEQLRQDIAILDEQLETLLTLSQVELNAGETENEPRAAVFAHSGDSEGPHASLFIPDFEPVDINKSVFEIVKRAFQIEALFDQQLNTCLLSSQTRRHLKLELQLKMIILSTQQRLHLLEDRYGFAKSKSLLFQGLRRQTTRFLSAISGDKRNDIDP
jgi:hypothetical protein